VTSSGVRPLPGRLVLLGHPVAHSLSPAFQNAALEQAGLPLRYEALDVPPAAFADVLRGIVAQRGAGNVTVPHKEEAARRCDLLLPAAERAGAVNTFWTDADGALVGDNTDIGGVGALARHVLGRAPANLRVALVGAGGSASAVLAAAERWPGCYVAVWSRTPERTRALVDRFAGVAHATRTLDDAVRDADLVVNATPVGLHGEDVPVDPLALKKGAAVMDLVYRRDALAIVTRGATPALKRAETPWVRRARERGHRAADGLVMLVEQGALAFERWFGVMPDRDAMWSAVR
jgi:shikimate dehydrogenase